MKFRMISLATVKKPHSPNLPYPYEYRIELVEYSLEERLRLASWLSDIGVPQNTVLGWNTGSIIYLREEHAVLFSLTWS
jgi:hypothetical protein